MMRVRHFGLSLLWLIVMMLVVTSHAIAGEFCTTFPEDPPGSGTHVVDGSDPATVAFINDNNVTQITVDTSCTFRNWDPLKVTINFQTPATGTKPIYLITFDNVNYTGNMSCANVDHKIWMVNGSSSDFSSKCQDLFIPVEAISKQVPLGKTTVGIGEEFTYSLIIPVLYDPASGTVINTSGTDVDVHSVTVIDDLNTTGADLTVVGTPTVTWVSDGTSVPHTYDPSYQGVNGRLLLDINPVIPKGRQIRIDITVVPDNTNTPGTTFVNTATWDFGRVISLDPDGDGIYEDVFFDPLPGENGVSAPLTIGAPVLTLDKTSLDTTLAPGGDGNFTLDVQNNGNTDAWDTTIVDRLPESGTASMCGTDPTDQMIFTPVTAAIYEADGSTLVRTLALGVDYTASFAASPTCELTFSLTGANAVIAQGQRLIITYQARLEPGASVNGEVLTNFAGATQWYSADGSQPRITYTGPLTNGTPSDNTDNQDSFEVTVGLAGYYFQKTVSNLDSGANPATSAQAGDTLRYRLRVFNVNQTVNGVVITDQLDPVSFDFSTFSLVSAPGTANVNFNFGTGLLTIDGGAGSLDVAQGSELVVEFDITTKNTLGNNDPVSNQALLSSSSGSDVESDDPFVNGVDDPQDAVDEADPTVVTIQQPGPPAKSNGPSSAVIGNTFTHTITVPATPVSTPLYDVRIEDSLGVDSAGTATVADVGYVGATATGGSWILTNTGTSSSPVIEDLGAGIDIPAGGQAVITMTVRLDNTLTNQAGVQFYNTVSYTYNRTNGVPSTQVAGGGVTTTSATTIFEPGIVTFSKVADNTTPTVGQIVHYTVTMTAQSGANVSDVFDVVLIDVLDIGLAYVPGSANVSTGAGVGADNSVTSTDVFGDGINSTQILVWTTANADIDIQAGDTVTFGYDVVVTSAALANQVLNNNIFAQWTSIDGANTYERTGLDGEPGPGVLNDYFKSAPTTTVTTPNIVATIDKARGSDTYGAGDDSVRIGDIVEYSLTIPVPEGTLDNLQLVDTLPQGLDFIGVVSINGDNGPDPFTAVAPFSHTDIPLTNIVESGNPATGPTTVTWNLGDISNPYNDGFGDNFVIVYRAQVLNNDVLAQINSTPLNNAVTMTYDTASGTVNSSDNTTVVNVLQPNLMVNKSASPANGDIFIEAGEVITYTIDIVNTGAAPAYDTVLEDVIPAGLRNAVTTTGITLHTTSTDALVATLTPFNPGFNAATGLATWNFDSGVADAYTIPVGETLRVVYTVTADNPITQGLILSNAATATLYYSFDDEAVPAGAVANDREIYGPSNTAGTTLYTTSPPTKALITPAPGTPQATIGEDVVYQITVPGTPSSSTLYDVQITDALDPSLIHLTADTTITGGTGVTNNSTVNALDVNVAQIPAGTQVVIELHTRLNNVNSAQDGVTIDNTASYNYAFTSGGAQQTALDSTNSVTVTVVEPELNVSKVATPVTPAPITGGDIVEYTLTIQNTGTSTAFDINVVDTLPSGLILDTTFTPTAAIDTVPVAGFNPTPSGAPGGPLVWGRGNGDGSLAVPSGSTLVLVYRVLIDASVQANVTLSNSALVDWTSLDGAISVEREGAGCPSVTPPDDYCAGPAISNIVTTDTNSFSKAVTADSYPPGNDGVLRVGDTVTYQLSLNLQEGTTSNVAVSDVLDAGLEFLGIVSINGDSTANYTPPANGPGSNFSYAPITAASLPSAGATGTLSFTIGDVANDPLGDATTDTLTIVYQARVAEDTIAQAPSTTLNNNATLSYVDGGGNVVNRPDSSSVEIRQPVMTAVTKLGNGAANTSGTPLAVNIATDTVQFTVESCNNTGLAPAYNVHLTDVLASQLEEGSITAPTVTINGSAATDGVDYNYTPPAARGGSLVFDLITPVNPGQCVTVVYNIGFHTDFGPNQLWSNSATLDEYWSLDGSTGQQYAGPGPASFWMTNTTIVNPLTKSMTAPVSGEATIGETVVYQITVPGSVANAALYDVVVNDPLNPGLQFVSVIDISGNSFPLTTSVDGGNNLTIGISQIPAGQQAVIQLTTRVANNASANVGTSFTNTAGYTYADSPGGATNIGGNGTTATSLLITEPALSINKSVTNLTSPGNPPTAGNVLRYTLTLQASGGAAGDNFSDAFDVGITDNLGSALAYESGTSTVSAGTIGNPVTSGDGVNTPQQLTWSLASATADIDIAEGSAVTVTYDVLVLNNALAGQNLTNSAVSEWTGLDGAVAVERDGAGCPSITPPDDYCTGPATTSLTTPDNTSFTKTRLTDTFGTADVNVRIGDIVEYELRATLPEGVTLGAVFTDSLPQGMAFEQAIINSDATAPYSAVAPFSYADVTPVVSGNPATGATTVTFNVGNIINDGDNNPANDDFVIVYRVRVLDNVFPQVNSTALNNAAQFEYTTASGAQTQNGATATTLLQPTLTISKSAAPAGGDNVIIAGELVTYTVDVTNTGTAPAYDTVVEDIIAAGMRNGAATVTVLDTQLPIGNDIADITPSYNASTGLVRWDFDTGVANAYTILPGQTLHIIYQVQADADLGAGLTLTNQAVASLYYSYDDEAAPNLGGITTAPEIYGPSNTASTTLTSPVPGTMLKQTPFELTTNPDDQYVTVGQTFSYRITIPETPLPIALHDVRILDNLTASAADLSFVGVAAVGGPYTWTPVNTGTATSLVIQDTTTGIDIPANGQITLDVTLQVDDAATNVSGLTFNNTASWTYNQLPNDPASQQSGIDDTSGDMTIIGPDVLTLEKSGPVTMRIGVPGNFRLNIHNDNSSGTSSPAWDITIVDRLANPTQGGMCDTAPDNFVASIYQADGTTLVTSLTQNVDYVVNFDAPGCTLTFTMQSANAALPADDRLIIDYQAHLDIDTPPNLSLTNIAGVTEWFSNDTAGVGATGQTRTFSRTLTNGTPTTLDHEDAFTVLSEAPVISIQKTVVNMTTGQNPGSDASPGDTLRYSILIHNVSPVDLPDFSFIDDLGAINANTVFTSGTLNMATLPAGAVNNSNATGGTNGAGLVTLDSLTLGVQGSSNDTVLIEFEVTLEPVIASGTVVLNQGQIQAPGVSQVSDDPNVSGADDPAILGDENPTETTITSAPQFQVQKTSQDMTGDPAVLVSGDILRYTITVKNIGNENAVNVTLQDSLPGNTTYVAASTTLNGAAVADAAGGALPLINGILINAPENTTGGFVRADASATTSNVATITFDVTINNNIVNGTLITNQGFVDAEGEGSGTAPQQSSDDPTTAVPDDPTVDIVGNLPLVDAQKTVGIRVDNGSSGVVDPGDVLRYTITVTNTGPSQATGATLTDAVPVYTTYVTNSVTLNGITVPDDVGLSPLIAGIDISSSDLTPPLPTPGGGVLSSGGTATVTFDVRVVATATPGTVISNQGSVDNDQTLAELTDADGIDTNGDQPTLITVGDSQTLSILKEVSVVGGGPALAGGMVQYRILVTNIGTLPATNVIISDNLDLPVAGQLSYVPGSGRLNGLPGGISFAAPLLAGNYSATYGDLAPGDSAELRFQATINGNLAVGTTITNIGEVNWNSGTQTASDSVDIDVGGIPGVAGIGGTLWHDVDYDNVFDSSEFPLAGWTVEVYLGGVQLANTVSDNNGVYVFNGLQPNDIGTDSYEVRFIAPGAVVNTASLGVADSPFTDSPQNIRDIVVSSGDNVPVLNLPIDPNGVVYNSVLRTRVAGVTLSMINASNGNLPVPSGCFDDPNQQDQVTQADGYYKFDMNFSVAGGCDVGDTYVIQVTPPASGYVGTTSAIIPPEQPGPVFSVQTCPGSAIDPLATTPDRCEIQASENPPSTSISPRTPGTAYYLEFTLGNSADPFTSQIFNNHIPVDPELSGAVSISKTSSLINVTRSQLVPYTITLSNAVGAPLQDLNVVDMFPAGFKYVAGSARVDDEKTEPVVNGLTLTWSDLSLNTQDVRVIKLLLVVGSGVGEGEYVNKAQAINNRNGDPASGQANATVRVVPDPTFDCSDIIGKVFDDKNLNGYQDEGEPGIASARVVTARGIEAKTDEYGRFHITCAIVPNENRGSNFILKLDERSLPSGYRMTTENPRVQRATRGKMLKFNFGAAVHRVVRLDMADGVFEPGSTKIRPQWLQRVALLMEKLVEAPSVLRLAYVADVEDSGLVDDRLQSVKEEIERRWEVLDCCYRLEIETEIFWRRGKPASKDEFDD